MTRFHLTVPGACMSSHSQAVPGGRDANLGRSPVGLRRGLRHEGRVIPHALAGGVAGGDAGGGQPGLG